MRAEYGDLPFTYFVKALALGARFKDLPQEWWLRSARLNHWSTLDMMAEAKRLTLQQPKSVTPADRRAWLIRRADAAEAAFREIEALVTSFNSEHATFYGYSLDLQVAPTAKAKAS